MLKLVLLLQLVALATSNSADPEIHENDKLRRECREIQIITFIMFLLFDSRARELNYHLLEWWRNNNNGRCNLLVDVQLEA